ncbi:MaoC family dehydratase [Salinibacterium sp. SYSU T00001]|uniref:MaoC family dehydratase n=1 Tax=Homoserinimonas sedimenticola TaxID=2986805 RepID=UPI00223621C7|nr:MaoC family dehydratase [Salinibacterium sedimenticola]MCW4384707.1 MaoC family dehydratase [Salinibacterium sedimenticola]
MMREEVQRGLWFEELEEGVRYVHRPGRTITEGENIQFSAMTMNPQGLHIDSHFAAGEEFGRPLVNSLLTLSIMVGQAVAHLTQGTTVANLGFERVEFPHPLFPGDTLRTETVVTGKRLSRSRPGQGIVTFEHTGRNQEGVVVGVAVRSTLVWCERRET